MRSTENSSKAVLLEHSDAGIVTLTLNRPERRNALNVEMTVALGESLRRAASDAAVRAVVLTGAGGAFCAGGDVKAMAEQKYGTQSTEERVQSLRSRAEASRWLYEMPKPTIAVIGGPAAGAGLALALACDFRVAVSGAKLTTAFGKVGLSGDFGVSYFLPRLVGIAKARELMMLCPVLSSEEALGWGLVHRVYEGETFEALARAFVVAVATGPTVALGKMKQNLNSSFDQDLSAALDAESRNQISCFSTADHVEAAGAFVDKRAPRFDGR